MSDSFLSQEEVDALLEGVTGESQKSVEEVAEGLILTCQAHPTSAEIYVDFDDV